MPRWCALCKPATLHGIAKSGTRHWRRGLLAAALAAPMVAGAAAGGLCEHGRRQSPVDIVAPHRQALPPIGFHYREVPLRLANDGHTVRVRLANGGYIVVGQERYALQQFHFHTPGGDRIDGREFDMAAHLIHKGKAGQLMVVVVLFRQGAENPLLADLLPRIPKRVDGDHLLQEVRIDAARLLPRERGYYSYEGSLTGPPCTEGVNWLVMKQAVELSADQLARYKRLFPDNARPVQPLHGRAIRESI